MDIFDGNFSSIPSDTDNLEQSQSLNGSLLDDLEKNNVNEQPTASDPVEQFVEEEQNRLDDIGLQLDFGQKAQTIEDEVCVKLKLEKVA